MKARFWVTVVALGVMTVVIAASCTTPSQQTSRTMTEDFIFSQSITEVPEPYSTWIHSSLH